MRIVLYTYMRLEVNLLGEEAKKRGSGVKPQMNDIRFLRLLA
jgi:hypothetical protein